MKPAQWTAVLLLALMVGGISFVSVYLGGNRGTGALPAETSPSLSFPFKLFPRDGEKVQTTEFGQRGHQDFWFTNESGQDVTVGLNAKGCTCSEVEITLAPPQSPRALANLSTWVAAYDRAHLDPILLSDGAVSKMLTKENALVVPAGAIGRVRLSWRQERQARPKRLNAYADLWMGQRGGSVNARLEVNVFISPPLEVSKALSLSAVSERDLETRKEGQQASIVCFSWTRPAFDLKAELLHERLKPESDAVEVGEPIPLKSEELPRMQNETSKATLTALSGYRIPLTVRAKAKDGTPIEWGRFRRVVRLSSSDEGIDPAQIKVTGEVRGDITLSGGKEVGMINLGPFPRNRGARGSIVLQSDEKAITLELDAARKPEYLNATLGKPEETGGGHRRWVLRVEVPPGAARGEFPNADNPVYRDSAIYVKTRLGKTQTSHRSIRIPVLGVANEG